MPARAIEAVALLTFIHAHTPVCTLVLAGCNGKISDKDGTQPDPTPGDTAPITSLSRPILGFSGSSNVRFEAPPVPEHDVVLASGTLVAAASRFDAEFRPLAEVPSTVLQPGSPELPWENGDVVCDIAVVPAELRAIAAFTFFQVEGFGMLLLSTFDFFSSMGGEATPLTVGSRFYTFLLADRAARIQGTCAYVDGDETIEYALDLARGWNPVAFMVAAVDSEGLPESWRLQSETPVSEAKWFYFGLDSD